MFATLNKSNLVRKDLIRTTCCKVPHEALSPDEMETLCLTLDEMELEPPMAEHVPPEHRRQGDKD